MLRNCLPLVLMSSCLLGASATWADDMGYVDCTNHPDDTPVAAKAAKTQETVGSLPCGERFAILQSGFFFTRIQTREGKVGYVYTNLISHDYSASAAAAAPPAQAVQAPAKMAARSSNPLSAIAAAFKPKSAPAESLRVPPPPAAPAPAAKPAPTQTSAAVAQPAAKPVGAPAASEPASNALFPAKSGVIVLNDTVPPSGSEPKPVQQAAANRTNVKVGETFSAKSGVIVQNETAASVPPQPKPAQATPAPAKAPVATENFSAKSAVVVQNERSVAMAAEPAPSQASARPAGTADITPPAVSVILEPQPSAPAEAQPGATPEAASNFQPEAPRPAMQRTRGEGRHWPSIEVFGGYSFARLNSGAGTFTNYSGGMGAFGLNLMRWLQVSGDSSYNMIQSNGTKVVLYGNHYGPRLFWHSRNRWNATPFVEGLFGGTRLDTTVSGTGGYTASSRVFSMKVGGGVDIRPSRRLMIRLFDVDYYRTAFTGGTTPYQSNYWISTGVVLHLFGRLE
jgi:hypothetical protein